MPKRLPKWQIYFNPKEILPFEKDQVVDLEQFTKKKMKDYGIIASKIR